MTAGCQIERRSPVSVLNMLLVCGALTPFAASVIVRLGGEFTYWRMLALAVVSAGAYASMLVGLLASFRNSGRIGLIVFVAGMLFWFYGPSVVAALSTDQWATTAARVVTSNDDASLAFLLIALFGVIVTVGYRLRFGDRVSRRLARALSGRGRISWQSWIVAASILWLLGFVFYMLAADGLSNAIALARLSRSGEKPWSFRGNYGTAVTPFHVLATYALVVSSGAMNYAAVRARCSLLGKALLAASSAFAMTWVATESGTRSLLIQCALPPLILIAVEEYARNRGVRARWIVVGVLVAGMLLVAANAQRQYRTTSAVAGISIDLQDNDFLLATAQAVSVRKAEADENLGGFILLDLLAGPIPRVLWPGKPRSRVVPVFTRYIWGIDIEERGGNYLPSIVGQAYLAWGWLGVIYIALVVGFAIGAGDRVFGENPKMVLRFFWAQAVAYLFVAFRMVAFGYFGAVYVGAGIIVVGRAVEAARSRLERRPAGCRG